MRTVWPRLAPDGLRSTAYALEASLQEIFFVGGPLLVAALALVDPVAGVAGAAVAAAVGTVAVATLPPVRETAATVVAGGEPARRARVRRRPHPVCFALAVGVGFGTVEVAMPAFAEEHGARELGGLALAAFSAGSFLGGMLVGMRPTRDAQRRLLVCAPLVALGLCLLLLAWSIPSLCVLAFVAGLPIAPGVAATYGLIDGVAPPWAIAEAFAWFGMAVALGAALGIALGGAAVDHLGVSAAFAVGPVAVLGGAARPVRARGQPPAGPRLRSAALSLDQAQATVGAVGAARPTITRSEPPSRDERLRHKRFSGPTRPAARFPLAWGRSPAEPRGASERSTLRSERP